MDEFPATLRKSIKKAKLIMRTDLFRLKDEKEVIEHSKNVAKMAKEFGQYLKSYPEYKEQLFDDDLLRLFLAGLIHDWSKDLIKIWKKPGVFTEKERKIMHGHSQKSVDIVFDKNVTRDWAVMVSVRDHHRYENGQGYPQIFREKLLLSKILSIVDAYDAMISPRSYKKEKNKQEALAELIKGKGTQFDADLVDKFVIFMGGSLN